VVLARGIQVPGSGESSSRWVIQLCAAEVASGAVASSHQDQSVPQYSRRVVFACRIQASRSCKGPSRGIVQFGAGKISGIALTPGHQD
jgi:hypothetical protein